MLSTGLMTMLMKTKSDDAANKHREFGNDHYQRRNYSNALVEYNKSICLANSKEVIALGYANRSAVFMEIELYDECLKNIELAGLNGYPKSKEKLNEREKKCKELMQQQKKKAPGDPWEFFKLSYPPNKKIPWIVDCLEMRRTEEYGRGIYATKDLKAGDVICIEEPIIQLPNPDTFFKRCINCLKISNMNLIPCVRTGYMMFCSFECRDKVYANAVQVEDFPFHDLKMLTVMTELVGGLQNLLKILRYNCNTEFDKSIFDFDWSDTTDPNYNLNLSTCLFSLMHNYPLGDYFNILYNGFSTKKIIPRYIAAFIFGIIQGNIFGHYCYDNNIIENFFDRPGYKTEGNYISLFNGLINHDCFNNVEFYSVDNKVATVVCKPIKAGEQIFGTYKSKDLKEESILFRSQSCKCKICIEGNDQAFGSIGFTVQNFTPIFNRNDFFRAKELLNKGITFMNNESQSSRMFHYYKKQNDGIMMFFAYCCSYPF